MISFFPYSRGFRSWLSATRSFSLSAAKSGVARVELRRPLECHACVITAPGLGVRQAQLIEDGDRVRLRLRFPSEDYEEEYGACRQYLPAEAMVDRAALASLGTTRLPAGLGDLARRRVIVDLPKKYY